MIVVVMGLTAVLGDIHANEESFDVVLRDISKRDVSHLVFVGDIVGYGPGPRHVVKKIRELEQSGKYVVIAVGGNHDEMVNSKSKHLEMPVAMMGMKGLGAFEGVHIACRQLHSDYSSIPTDGKPAVPAVLTAETRKKYHEDLASWRDVNVEPQTQEAIRAASSPNYAQSALDDACNALNLDSKVRIGLSQRAVKAPDMVRLVLQEAFSKAEPTQLRAALYHLEQFLMRKEDVYLREYLANLKPAVNVEISANGVTVPVFVVHDNPFEPGDIKYLYDRADIRKYSIRGTPLTIDDVFASWKPEWGKVVMFGHSHIAGAYEDGDKLIINPGSAGSPRYEEAVTYALWDPAVPGKAGVNIVRFTRFGRHFTEHKMKQVGLPLKRVHDHAEVS